MLGCAPQVVKLFLVSNVMVVTSPTALLQRFKLLEFNLDKVN